MPTAAGTPSPHRTAPAGDRRDARSGPDAGDRRDARERLDGLDRGTLQRRLYTTCHRDGTEAVPERRALAQALVHMRRTGGERYNRRDHVLHAAQEASTLDPAAVAQVRHAAVPARGPVRILGERHTGTVIHLVIGRDPGDLHPSPWYVVAVDGLRVCRAHGAEEIEPTPALG